MGFMSVGGASPRLFKFGFLNLVLSVFWKAAIVSSSPPATRKRPAWMGLA